MCSLFNDPLEIILITHLKLNIFTMLIFDILYDTIGVNFMLNFIYQNWFFWNFKRVNFLQLVYYCVITRNVMHFSMIKLNPFHWRRHLQRGLWQLYIYIYWSIFRCWICIYIFRFGISFFKLQHYFFYWYFYIIVCKKSTCVLTLI